MQSQDQGCLAKANQFILTICALTTAVGVWITYLAHKNSEKQTDLNAEQLAQGNRLAKISYTLDFIRDLENREFLNAYRRAYVYLRDTNPRVWPTDDQLTTDIKHVMDKFTSLATFYSDDVLDQRVIEDTIGLEVARICRVAKPWLKETPGWESLIDFGVTMEKALATRHKKFADNAMANRGK